MSWRILEAGPLGWAKEGTGQAAGGAALGEGPGMRVAGKCGHSTEE